MDESRIGGEGRITAEAPRQREALRARLRRAAGAVAIDNGFRGLSAMGKLALKRRLGQGVEVVQNVPYRQTGRRAHLLDIYRPAGASGPLPTVFYVHGGGFRILSKDTHWVMGYQFAQRGYQVVNINYRLSGEAPFPAAIEDTCLAYSWLADHADELGVDRSRVVLAGESAGGNLVTSLAIAATYERPEAWAGAVFERGLLPRAVVAACGMLQVSDPARFERRRRLPRWLADRIEEVCNAYLREPHYRGPGGLDLADPLLVLERGERPARPLPPFYAPCGTRDPLLDDTRRLARALEQLGVPCEVSIHPGEVHAFHAFVWRREAQICWARTFAFLDASLGAAA